jgi:hypothetical protein
MYLKGESGIQAVYQCLYKLIIWVVIIMHKRKERRGDGRLIDPAATHSTCPLPPQSLCPRLPALVAIQSGPDVEVECHVLRVVRVGSASVKVDDISYLRSTSVNDPVVSIERWSVASHEHQLRPSLLRSKLTPERR